MAQVVEVRGVPIKLGRPWVAFRLAIVTLGIYKVWRLEAEEGAKRELGMRGVAPST